MSNSNQGWWGNSLKSLMQVLKTLSYSWTISAFFDISFERRFGFASKEIIYKVLAYVKKKVTYQNHSRIKVLKVEPIDNKIYQADEESL